MSAPYVAKERLYIAMDKKSVVKEGDPKAAFLLSGIGQIVPDYLVKKYGLDAATNKESKTIAPEQIESRSTTVFRTPMKR